MAHTDADHYAAKHPLDRPLNKNIAAAVKQSVAEDGIACADAAAISRRLGVAMQEVGVTIDLLEMRIKWCQLGLFGFDRQMGILQPANEVAPDLEIAIRENLVEGRLPCVAAWEIAERKRIPRMDVASVCEKLKIRIKPCQLGAF